jgi:hypothetical protein
MRSAGWSPAEPLKWFSVVLLKKMGYIALAWVVVYFISQPFRDEKSLFLSLFAPIPGAIAGLVAGWYVATDSVEESSLQGLFLWVLLVTAAVLPMWVIEGILHLITRWSMNFGGFMLLTASSLMALAAAVWHASSQE